MAKKQEGMVTPKAAAEFLGISVRSLERYADDSDKPIVAVKYSRSSVRYDMDELVKFKEQCRVVKV